MKRVMAFMLLAFLALSGFSGGIMADEVTPPPDPGIEDGGAGEPGEEPGGDDNPWGGEERSSGTTNPGRKLRAWSRSKDESSRKHTWSRPRFKLLMISSMARCLSFHEALK